MDEREKQGLPEENMADQEHPRRILHNFLSQEDCKELEFIHKSCSAVGYRPSVFSTTLSHLIATNCAPLIMPFVPIRERLKEKVEEFFGCEYELVIEFTGLISWARGASIGWHSDDNRSYLKQRDFTAVCYLNNYGEDFKGGIFHFQDGEPTAFRPVAGDVVMYTADSRNTHCVDEVTGGERLTLTLWFSRDSSHDEDAKVVSLLSQSLLHCQNDRPLSCFPLAASNIMYWFRHDQGSQDEPIMMKSGFDIRLGRLHAHGFSAYFSKGIYTSDISDLLMQPILLARKDQALKYEFVNILHALQVLQFHNWRGLESQTKMDKTESFGVIQLSDSQREDINLTLALLLKDSQQAKIMFGSSACNEMHLFSFDWNSFSTSIRKWESYMSKLYEDISGSLPRWRANDAMYHIILDTS